MNRMPKLNRIFTLLAIVAIAFFAVAHPSRMIAQVAGATLSGLVTDPTGAPIPEANLVATNVDTGVKTTIKSDKDGVYSVPNLLPGNYQVSVSAAGFSSKVATGITLTVGATATLNVQLEVGNVTETVDVNTAASGVELTSSQISQVVSGLEMRQLPLNGRSWTDLVTLEPGVSSITTQQALATGGQTRANRGFGQEFSIAGARPNQSNFRLDGISINDYANNGPGSAIGGNLGVDAIAEFEIISSNYSAEYGKTSGGVVNAISRPGTDQFHGNVYEFIRNSAVDARNYFDPLSGVPEFRRNQFGGSVGGPIRKDKTFFFGDFEGIRQAQGVSTLLIVPSDQARLGHLCSAPTGGSCTPSTVVVDPTVAKFLPLFPTGSTPVASSNGDAVSLNLATLQTVNENFFTVRFDNKFSDKDSGFISWQFDRTPFTVPDVFNDVINGDYTFRQFFIGEITHTFSSNLVSTLRAGFNWEHESGNTPNGVNNPLAADTSLSATGTSGPVGVAIGGGYTVFLGGLGLNNSVFDKWRNYELFNDTSWVFGKHNFKIGGEVEIMRDGHVNNSNQGKFAFGSIHDFLINNPSNFAGLLPGVNVPEFDVAQSLFGLYLQDDWKMTRKLTVNLGVRYEPLTSVSEKNGNWSMLRNLTDTTAFLGNPIVGNNSLRNFSPRVGIVWDPFGEGKTSIRSGFGIFDYLPLMYLWNARQATLAPQTLSAAVTSGIQGTFTSGAVAKLSPSAKTNEVTDQQPGRSYQMQWNFSVQQQIHNTWTATLGYVGSHGDHLPVEEESVNLVLPSLIEDRWVTPINGNRVNSAFSKITGQYFNGKSMYNGLLATIVGNIGKTLTARSSFTYSKVIDIGSNVSFGDQFANANPSLPFFDLGHLARGPSDFNIGKIFNVNALYSLPTAKDLHGVGGVMVNGWQLGGILNVSDGSPFTATYGFNSDPLGSKSTTPVAIPDINSSVPGCGTGSRFVNSGNAKNYIREQCYEVPQAPDMAFWNTYCVKTNTSGGPVTYPNCFNIYGNAGRNNMQGPGYRSLDMALYKETKLGFREGANLELRFEAFNILNHTNFAPPMTSLGQADALNAVGVPNNAAGSLVSTVGSSRQLQAAVKFSF
jgi:hypothetical protein